MCKPEYFLHLYIQGSVCSALLQCTRCAKKAKLGRDGQGRRFNSLFSSSSLVVTLVTLCYYGLSQISQNLFPSPFPLNVTFWQQNRSSTPVHFWFSIVGAIQCGNDFKKRPMKKLIWVTFRFTSVSVENMFDDLKPEALCCKDALPLAYNVVVFISSLSQQYCKQYSGYHNTLLF